MIQGEHWRVSAEGGKPEKFDLPPVDFPRQLRIHPDGKRVAFTAGSNKTDVWVMENFLPATESQSRARGK